MKSFRELKLEKDILILKDRIELLEEVNKAQSKQLRDTIKDHERIARENEHLRLQKTPVSYEELERLNEEIIALNSKISLLENNSSESSELERIIVDIYDLVKDDGKEIKERDRFCFCSQCDDEY